MQCYFAWWKSWTEQKFFAKEKCLVFFSDRRILLSSAFRVWRRAIDDWKSWNILSHNNIGRRILFMAFDSWEFFLSVSFARSLCSPCCAIFLNFSGYMLAQLWQSFAVLFYCLALCFSTLSQCLMNINWVAHTSSSFNPVLISAWKCKLNLNFPQVKCTSLNTSSFFRFVFVSCKVFRVWKNFWSR